MGKVKVLIAEDESIVAIDLRTRLEAHGYEVVKHVLTGSAAIEQTVLLKPDIVLMDIHLKDGIDGIEAARQIREQLPIPVIFLTAYADNETLERAKLTDVFGYIIKPYQERELFINIEIALYKYEMEEKLKSSQSRLDTTLRSIADAVITTNSSGKIDFMNGAAEELLQIHGNDIIGKDIDDIISINKMQNTSQMQHQISGKIHTLEVSDSEIRDIQNNVTGDVYVLRDVSTRVEYEQQLRKAKTVAEEASSLKSDFLANMSHELRTPLNSILGLTELSLESDTEDERREYLMIVKQAGESLLNLINSILDFSKIEAGKMKKEDIPFDLQQILEDTIEKLYIQAHKKGISLSLKIKSDCPLYLIGDSHKIFQIIMNLIGNSIKFTESGYIRLEVELVSLDEIEAVIQFEICDTGKGIPLEKLEHIFGSFTQVDSSSTRIHGGTGLGLAIVKRLVELLNGSINVVSEIEKGSTFTFQLPMLLDESRDQNSYVRIFPHLKAKLMFHNQYDYERISNELKRMQIKSSEMKIPEFREMNKIEPNTVFFSDSIMMQKELKFNQNFIKHIEHEIILVSEMREQSYWRNLGVYHLLINPLRISSIQNEIQSYFEQKKDFNVKKKRPKSIEPGSISLNILLLEDEKNNRLIAEKILRQRGHQVTSMEDGHKGLEKLIENEYDVVLVDIQMPELDGLEFTRIVRKGLKPVKNQNIPIIAVTAHAFGGYREKCLKEGMNGFITKPYTVKSFIEVIEQTIENLNQREVMPLDTKLKIVKQLEKYIENNDFEQIEASSSTLRYDSSLNSELSEHIFRMILAARRKDKQKIEQIWHQIMETTRAKGGM